MRTEAEHLDHAPDGALLDEIAGVDCALDVEPLAVIDGVLAACPGDHCARVFELIQGCEWGFIGKVILAALHDLAADGAAVAWDGGGFCLGIFRTEGGDLRRVGIIDPLQLATGLEQPIGLAENVAVIEVRGGEGKFARLYHRLRAALRRVVHSVGLFDTHG